MEHTKSCRVPAPEAAPRRGRRADPIRRHGRPTDRPVAAASHPTASTKAMITPFDQQFIDMMAPHHQSAVAMAQIALTRTQHPQIKSLARSIIADQGSEIAQMKTWRTAWYVSSTTPRSACLVVELSGKDRQRGDTPVRRPRPRGVVLRVPGVRLPVASGGASSRGGCTCTAHSSSVRQPHPSSLSERSGLSIPRAVVQ